MSLSRFAFTAILSMMLSAMIAPLSAQENEPPDPLAPACATPSAVRTQETVPLEKLPTPGGTRNRATNSPESSPFNASTPADQVRHSILQPIPESSGTIQAAEPFFADTDPVIGIPPQMPISTQQDLHSSGQTNYQFNDMANGVEMNFVDNAGSSRVNGFCGPTPTSRSRCGQISGACCTPYRARADVWDDYCAERCGEGSAHRSTPWHANIAQEQFLHHDPFAVRARDATFGYSPKPGSDVAQEEENPSEFDIDRQFDFDESVAANSVDQQHTNNAASLPNTAFRRVKATPVGNPSAPASGGVVIHPPMVQPYNPNQHSFVIENTGDSDAIDVVIEVSVPEQFRILATAPKSSVNSEHFAMFRLDSLKAGEHQSVHLTAVSDHNQPIPFEASLSTRSVYEFQVHNQTTRGILKKVAYTREAEGLPSATQPIPDRDEYTGPVRVHNPFFQTQPDSPDPRDQQAKIGRRRR